MAVPQGGKRRSIHKINFIRYCDDFIVTASGKEILENEVMPAIESFLKPRGLSLSKEKTQITHIEDGFDFLGQNPRKYGGKLLIKPSKRNTQRFLEKIRQVFDARKASSTWELIQQLNPIIKGWAYYHRHAVSKDTYNKIDHLIFRRLRRWTKRKHPRKSWKWIIKKYYDCPVTERKQFHGISKDGRIACLFLTSSIKIKRHAKIMGAANPFDPLWELYFEQRQDKKMLQSTSGKLRQLYYRQNGQCPICASKITKETGWNTHHVIEKHLGGSDHLDNLVLLHPNCHRQLHHNKRLSNQPQRTENQSVVSFA